MAAAIGKYNPLATFEGFRVPSFFIVIIEKYSAKWYYPVRIPR